MVVTLLFIRPLVDQMVTWPLLWRQMVTWILTSFFNLNPLIYIFFLSLFFQKTRSFGFIMLFVSFLQSITTLLTIGSLPSFPFPYISFPLYKRWQTMGYVCNGVQTPRRIWFIGIFQFHFHRGCFTPIQYTHQKHFVRQSDVRLLLRG